MLYGLTFTLNQYSNTRPTFSIHNNNELTTILTSDHLILCNASIGGCIGPRLLYNKIIWRCRILNHKVITRVISPDCLWKIEHGTTLCTLLLGCVTSRYFPQESTKMEFTESVINIIPFYYIQLFSAFL